MAIVLSELYLEHWRSHQSRRVDLGKQTVLIGPNGAGKTNLLEAVWTLATTRSFRTTDDTQVITWDQSFTRVRANTSLQQFELVIVREPVRQKVVRVDGVAKRPIDYLGTVRAVLFTPESLRIITGEPSLRRKFLDTVLAQSNPTYARQLHRYRHVVRQRNALLKAIRLAACDPEELRPWNQQLAELGTAISRVRATFITELLPSLQTWHATLSRTRPAKVLTLEFKPAGPPEEEVFLHELDRQRHREVAVQATLLGPHRDELLFFLADRLMAETASRGEIRSVILALKWAEYQYLSDHHETTVILLDDLFSELDSERRAMLPELFSGAQVFMTTTGLEQLPKEWSAHASIVDLGENHVSG